MIQEAVRQGKTSPELRRRFEKKALELLAMGALGFGEMTALHFSFGPKHPYEWAPPDHPLFLLLSDIAARHGVPIDIHMEAVPQEMPLPRMGRLRSPPNPKMLRPNIGAFERLLAHNRKAKIIWAHAGWDNTGHRSPELARKLLEKHPNLYMSIKVSRDSLPKNRPLRDRGTRLNPAWLKVIRTFPDRFLIGSDQFYVSPRARRRFPRSVEGTNRLLSLLPPKLAQKIGYENAIRIFKLEK
jgi:predicted TIM-barrel fold metal-dependent hydrolase